MMKSLREGKMKGFIVSIMSYNLKNFTALQTDTHAAIAVIKHRISTRVRERFELFNIKKNGKKQTVKIEESE